MMSSEQHRARARELRQENPDSRAAALHDMVAKAIDQNEPHDPETDELAKVYARKLARA